MKKGNMPKLVVLEFQILTEGRVAEIIERAAARAGEDPGGFILAAALEYAILVLQMSDEELAEAHKEARKIGTAAVQKLVESLCPEPEEKPDVADLMQGIAMRQAAEAG